MPGLPPPGDFAVVTALELALHPAPRLYGGRTWWAGEHAPATVDAYRQITTAATDELSVWLNLVQFPGTDPMVAVDVTHLGDQVEARDLLAPLIGTGPRGLLWHECGPPTVTT